MNFGNDPLLQQRNYTLPELEKEQEALQQKMAEIKTKLSRNTAIIISNMG